MKEEIKTHFHTLDTLLQKQSLDSQDVLLFEQTLQLLYPLRDSEELKKKMILLRNKHESISSDKTMQGLAFVKKHGYAGDYEIIDKIYTEWKSKDDYLATWDNYFHSQLSPIAVRNRKSYFKEMVQKRALELESKEDNFSVLNIASGPCRDLLEFFEETKDLRFQFDCVELDKNAISYAKELLGNFNGNVSFINENVFKFKPTKSYDLVWSAGLFDYFDDATFIKILSRYIKSPIQHKEIVIGNFVEGNPTAAYMELIGEWYLNHRSIDKLRYLSMQAGATADQIVVNTEATGVNLFLHIYNKSLR